MRYLPFVAAAMVFACGTQKNYDSTLQSLQSQVTALQETTTLLQTQVADLQTQNDTLSAEVTVLRGQVDGGSLRVDSIMPTIDQAEALFDYLSVNGNHDLVVSGANLYVQSGAGTTVDAVNGPNGKGNLIIGYDEDNQSGTALKTGSHCLVVGRGHTYTSFGGFVAGRDNAVTAESASILGGGFNSVSGAYGAIVGGQSNIAAGSNSSIGGGSANHANATMSTVSGSTNQTATSDGQLLP
jgi:hypothetical protein